MGIEIDGVRYGKIDAKPRTPHGRATSGSK